MTVEFERCGAPYRLELTHHGWHIGPAATRHAFATDAWGNQDTAVPVVIQPGTALHGLTPDEAVELGARCLVEEDQLKTDIGFKVREIGELYAAGNTDAMSDAAERLNETAATVRSLVAMRSAIADALTQLDTSG